ncbi:MAG: GldG family protein, partial [Phycisphaerales bacterium]
MAARTEARRNALIVIAAVLVGVVALNTVVSIAVPFARIDLTQDRLYSTSAGVDRALASLDEPVRVTLYWTQEGSKDQPLIRAHGQRVREYLEEIARRSKGNVEFRFVDPEPFSEAEDEARAAGLPALAVDGSGRTLTLGLVISGPTDRKETIPYLSPENEPLLEYELVRAHAAVGRPSKPKVGLLSTMPVDGGFDPRNPMQQKEPPVVVQQLREQCDVVPVDAAAKELPAGLQALVLLQPRTLSEDMLKAVDAWAVAGKPL